MDDKPKAQRPHPITIALAGNPNVGKSTIFNGLTGMKQHTGYILIEVKKENYDLVFINV